MNDKNDTTTEEFVQKYETFKPLLMAMFDEFRELSKKKPDAALSKKKVEIVNRLLKDILFLLEKEPTGPYLDLLDEETLPQNSDVVLILSQFNAAMKAFENRYYVKEPGSYDWFWNTQ